MSLPSVIMAPPRVARPALTVGVSFFDHRAPGADGVGRHGHARRAGAPAATGWAAPATLPRPALHGVTRPYEIYLPPGYWSFEHAVERYSVLYLLHGAPGVATDWLCRGRAAQTTDALIHSGRIMPLIIVMPDGNGGFERDTQYVNS